MSEKTLLTRAIEYAAKMHEGQFRKGTNIPYILHPLEAAAIVATMTTDEEVLAGAVLHDVVEDTAATVEDIRRMFSERVAAIVAGESEEKREDKPAAETWELRKQETLDHLASVDDADVLMVCLGDKLSNIRAIERDYYAVGERFWDRFNQRDPEKHAWYYSSIAAILEKTLGDTAAWREYDERVRNVFENHYGPQHLLEMVPGLLR